MCAVTEGRVRSRAARTASLPRHLQERARAHRRHPQRHRFRTTPAPDLPGPPHHEQLAALAGISRETTTKVLGQFAEFGRITLCRGKITILRLETLHQLAGE